jgi:hypothetical protein
MNTIKIFSLFMFFFTNQAFGYRAECFVDGLMERYDLDLKVENKVLDNWGTKYNFIRRSGGWYSYGDEYKTYYLGPMYKPTHGNAGNRKWFAIEVHFSVPHEYHADIESGTCSIF